MNPCDGSIYALASYPSFDQAAAAHNRRYLAQLLYRQNASTLLLDRATQGLYPVGSTFKPIVAEAALASGLITPSSIIPCTGSLTVGNVVFHNLEAGINANLNLDQALAMSCDTWFYRLGTAFYARQASTGALDMQRWAMRFGLGHPTGLDVPGEYGGVVPTPGWLRRTFRDPAQRIWYEGYSVNLSIGQGYLAVTPLQFAVAYSALANGGTVVARTWRAPSSRGRAASCAGCASGRAGASTSSTHGRSGKDSTTRPTPAPAPRRRSSARSRLRSPERRAPRRRRAGATTRGMHPGRLRLIPVSWWLS